MFFTILIAFVSLIGLVVLHELGHFVLAKKFGVKVEEFGIGYPPRLFGKKIGETIYSINLLPFGAFVKVGGEDKTVEDLGSLRTKAIWQRALILLGGVISFWVVAAILLSIVMSVGVPTAVGDEVEEGLVNPRVQIAAIVPDSPAEKAELKIGDAIIGLRVTSYELQTTKVGEIQEFTGKYKGEEVNLTIERGKEVFDVSLVPRISPPKGEGAMGVILVRTALQSYPWYLAPVKGIQATGQLTILVIKGLSGALVRALVGKPTSVQIMGPVGVFSLLTQASKLGVNYFLQFIAIIAVHLALFNLLPIPAVDGGRLLFLGIEKVRGKPIKEEIEGKLNGIFFILLVCLMIWVTVKDVIRLF